MELSSYLLKKQIFNIFFLFFFGIRNKWFEEMKYFPYQKIEFLKTILIFI